MTSPTFIAMKPSPPRVIGVDPGLARCGWAVITANGQAVRLIDAGCITTPSRQSTANRLHQLHQELMHIFRYMKPSLLAIEELFFTRNVSTAIAVGQARGVALLAAAEARIPVQEFTPTAVKQTVTGYGRADKRQVQSMIRILLGLSRVPKSDDTADAIAIALCGLHQPRWARTRL